MKLKFFSPKELIQNLTLHVHKTGKLGLSSEFARKFDIDRNTYVGFGLNADSKEDKSLYMTLLGKDGKDIGFKISKAGDYFYINTKYLFDNLKIDYKTKRVSFDLEEIEKHTFKLHQRFSLFINKNKA